MWEGQKPLKHYIAWSQYERIKAFLDLMTIVLALLLHFLLSDIAFYG